MYAGRAGRSAVRSCGARRSASHPHIDGAVFRTPRRAGRIVLMVRHVFVCAASGAAAPDTPRPGQRLRSERGRLRTTPTKRGTLRRYRPEHHLTTSRARGCRGRYWPTIRSVDCSTRAKRAGGSAVRSSRSRARSRSTRARPVMYTPTVAARAAPPAASNLCQCGRRQAATSRSTCSAAARAGRGPARERARAPDVTA